MEKLVRIIKEKLSNCVHIKLDGQYGAELYYGYQVELIKLNSNGFLLKEEGESLFKRYEADLKRILEDGCLVFFTHQPTNKADSQVFIPRERIYFRE